MSRFIRAAISEHQLRKVCLKCDKTQHDTTQADCQSEFSAGALPNSYEGETLILSFIIACRCVYMKIRNDDHFSFEWVWIHVN